MEINGRRPYTRAAYVQHNILSHESRGSSVPGPKSEKTIAQLDLRRARSQIGTMSVAGMCLMKWLMECHKKKILNFQSWSVAKSVLESHSSLLSTLSGTVVNHIQQKEPW